MYTYATRLRHRFIINQLRCAAVFYIEKKTFSTARIWGNGTWIRLYGSKIGISQKYLSFSCSLKILHALTCMKNMKNEVIEFSGGSISTENHR